MSKTDKISLNFVQNTVSFTKVKFHEFFQFLSKPNFVSQINIGFSEVNV